MKLTLLALLCLLVCPAIVWAQDSSTGTMVQETISVSRSEFEELKATVRALQEELRQFKEGKSAAAAGSQTDVEGQFADASTQSPADVETQADSSSGGGRQLALPDISLIVQAQGRLSTDGHDEGRDRLRISEAEIAVQGYVYPNVKADAYFATSPEEGVAMQVEEAYLTYLGVGNGLNGYVGEKHVPFGRTNLLHPHSLPYARQPLVLRDLVAEESLIGEGLQASYLIPTGSSLFAQIDLGTWTKSGHSHDHDREGEENESGIIAGEGAGFTDRFNTARLWLGYPITDDSEVEVGGSYADGASHGFSLGVPSDARLTGMDLSYRRFWEGNRRLLLRGETVRRSERADIGNSASNGYYLLADYRLNRYNNVGLLYDWSEFPQAPGMHESALSLIMTRQLSEQYYLRFQATHGSRPDDDDYNELRLQWVWGVGPHTHNLE